MVDSASHDPQYTMTLPAFLTSGCLPLKEVLEADSETPGGAQ